MLHTVTEQTPGVQFHQYIIIRISSTSYIEGVHFRGKNEHAVSVFERMSAATRASFVHQATPLGCRAFLPVDRSPCRVLK